MVVIKDLLDGWIAQLVEQRTENPRVAGSIPAPATPLPKDLRTNRPPRIRHRSRAQFFPRPLHRMTVGLPSGPRSSNCLPLLFSAKNHRRCNKIPQHPAANFTQFSPKPLRRLGIFLPQSNGTASPNLKFTWIARPHNPMTSKNLPLPKTNPKPLGVRLMAPRSSPHFGLTTQRMVPLETLLRFDTRKGNLPFIQ